MAEVCDINLFHRAMKILVHEKDPSLIINWLKLINKHIRLLTKNLINKEHGHKIKIQTSLCHLKRYKIQLKSLIAHKGAGNSNKRSDRVRWEDVQSAFESRLRTGVIINLKHIDFLEFLYDAFHLMKTRIKNALKKLRFIKINTVFCGQFIKKVEMMNC